MISRFVSPRLQASSSVAITSICQFGRNGVVGFSSWKLRSMKAVKSERNDARYSFVVSFMFALPKSLLKSLLPDAMEAELQRRMSIAS